MSFSFHEPLMVDCKWNHPRDWRLGQGTLHELFRALHDGQAAIIRHQLLTGYTLYGFGLQRAIFLSTSNQMDSDQGREPARLHQKPTSGHNLVDTG